MIVKVEANLMVNSWTVLACFWLQVVVICGRNKKLLADIKRTVWPGGTHVVACGFVDNIHEVCALWQLCAGMH
jgi:hypothetical protein